MPIHHVIKEVDCPKCDHTFTVSKTIETFENENDSPVLNPIAHGGSYGAGIGAGCATMFIIVFIFLSIVSLILKTIQWLVT